MELATKRFLIRDFTDEDTADFEAYHSDPRLQEFCGVEQSTPEHASQLIALFIAWAKELPRLNYQFAVTKHSYHRGGLVGCCGVRRAGAEPGTAELGIELAPEYWGQYYYAIEIMRTLVEFGFDTLGLHALYGGTVSANSRVARLVSAFGAKPITRPPPSWMSNKGWSHIEWRITKKQWQNSVLASRLNQRATTRH